MPVKEVKPKLDPETCSVCGRRLLQGEQVNWYVAPDSSRRVVCELCVPRANRANWIRERDGEEIVHMRPTRAARGSLFSRIAEFFGAQSDDDGLETAGDAVDSAAHHAHQKDRRTKRESRRQRPQEVSEVSASAPRSVRAVPTGPAARLQQGLALFNASQFPRTIAGLSRSLGEPQVAAQNDSDSSVDVYVGWDIAWYSYRVDLGDATEPVEQSGRGNDSAELSGAVPEWNAFADEYGRLHLRDPEVATQ